VAVCGLLYSAHRINIDRRGCLWCSVLQMNEEPRSICKHCLDRHENHHWEDNSCLDPQGKRLPTKFEYGWDNRESLLSEAVAEYRKLHTFTNHFGTCRASLGEDEDCTCGLDQLRWKLMALMGVSG
jgi:hypothetical protein